MIKSIIYSTISVLLFIKETALNNITIDKIKKEYKKHNLIYYTKHEEILNVLTHGFGAVLGLIGLVFMLIASSNTMSIIASITFCLPAITVYSTSAIYHAITNIKIKSSWRKADHANISFIILACGAPMCLCLSNRPYNYIALGLCFAIGLINIILCFKNLAKYSKFAFVMDYVVGVLMFSVFLVNRNIVPDITKLFYLLGAVSCVLGTMFYGIKVRFIHTIFHTFELAGTIFFYFGAYFIL